jgi:glycosyltransferase involved in cell wall biosynthesis
LKVLHVIASVDPRSGGPIEGVFASSMVWRENGHERHILCLDPPNAPFLGSTPVLTFAVGINGPVYEALRRYVPLLRYGYTPRPTSWLHTNGRQYDAIIVNGLWNYASVGSWRALQKLSVPYFVFTHGMLDPWFNKAYPIKTFFKSIYWKMFENRTLRDAQGVMFTCEEERELASKSFAPYSAKEFVVGYGTRDIEGDPAAQRAAFAEKAPRLNACLSG